MSRGSVAKLELEGAEAEGVGNDGDGAERHGGAGDDRAQEQTEEWIQQAGCDRYAERVIEKREDEDSGGYCAWWRG